MSADPADISPVNADPASVSVSYRRAAHQRRYDAQLAADDARSRVLGALLDGGTPPDVAAALVDELITTVRTADAHRLTYARGAVPADATGAHWGGLSSLNDADDYLLRSVTAYPVRG